MAEWSANDALKVYNLPYWGAGFFHLDEQGRVYVTPDKTRPDAKVVLADVVEQLKEEGYAAPVLLRFPDIIKSRIDALFHAFNGAIEDYGYEGDYLTVYPIKVNQQRGVLDAVTKAYKDKPRLGLEAGSKPELLAVLAHTHETESVIVCNGYKDKEYVRLALLGIKMGHQVYIVIEKLSELALVMEEAAKLKVSPRLGVRARLASQGAGKWQSSGGEKSKFGLSATQVLSLVNQLKEAGCIDWLQLLHFHLGSQIANIRDIQKGIRECGRFYAELRRLDVPVNIVDVGGGLGVDYEGTRSQSYCSANYNLREYANNVVWGIGNVCREYDLPHPRIISESGRAITAHHALLVANVISIESPQASHPVELADDAPFLLRNMWETWEDLCREDPPLLEIYHDTVAELADVHGQYSMGMMTLEDRAWAEEVHLNICLGIKQKLDPVNRAHRPIMDELNEKLADKCFVNFSLFQSLPDAWGIDQIFPVLPLDGLDRAPARRAVILDITCDSDGAIDQYVDGQGVETTLPMPEFVPGQAQYLGFFLVGAYQEILGDMHNLFGDTHSAEVVLDEDGTPRITNIKEGSNVAELLRYVDIDPTVINAQYELQASHPDLDEETRALLLKELSAGLEGYAYLEDEL
ncbi:biosynthetic arginine decarboxylase [Oceanimonas baumannii]|uniref:Biosynthetic arginine decarboxylase n=1 Tax=Oceanimonas baumannii TaxID=129578 RepID=A0A235CF46_9GAMM|nr:biosynthetic arginine decarboxylase [Oceanimonas baumannii]OYD23066.1 arginine decarboxylase [Oceanimonas baumannii]TDW58331.1 arginine decarboxylase [Oceanimonas baumannii]